MASATINIPVNIDLSTIQRWLESSDIVEVVRCKDCRRHEREQPGMVYCPNTVGNWVEDDWYCKGGERKDE